MKTKIYLLILLSFNFYLLSSQVPQGFNYQAIARDASGNAIANQSLPIMITIQSDSLGGTTFWIESFSTVTTNSFGVFTIIVGKGVKQTGSTVATFNDIDWKVTPKFINTQIYYQSAWKNMGTTRMWSVPYSEVSGALSGSLTRLAVKGNGVPFDSTLFEVKNYNGQTVFAVYNEGVRIYVDNGVAKGTTKGGFAIGGFGTAKAPSQEYFRVTRDSTRVNVNRLAKGSKGGFAIGGFDGVKAAPSDFFNLKAENYFIGQDAGLNITTGKFNSFLGYQSGFSNTEGNSNIFLGYQAGYSNTGGYDNIFIGRTAGYTNVGNSAGVTGSYNIFIGTGSGFSNLTGLRNIFMGYGSGSSNVSGESNIFIGMQAGLKNNSGTSNVFLGPYSGYNNFDGVNNLFIGGNAGNGNTSGSANVFIGPQSGQNNQTGQSNSYVGHLAGWYNIAGSFNTLMGEYAASNRTSGDNNVMIGAGTGQYAASGGNNVFVGTGAGKSNGGTGNIFIGYNAGTDETGSNRLYIENSSLGATNALIYGEFDNDIIKLNAAVTVRDLLNLKPRATAPSSPVKGDMYYDSALDRLRVYDGSVWHNLW